MNNPDRPTAAEAPTVHELKTDPEVFEAVTSGRKTFEIRKDDRGFMVGDTLLLRETQFTGLQMHMSFPLAYTGREERRTVSHILTGYGLGDGWCCLSFLSPALVQPVVPESDLNAGRYKWLRLHSWVSETGSIGYGSGANQTKPELLDAAIDEARGLAAPTMAAAPEAKAEPKARWTAEEIEAVICCLDDDAVKLLDANPEDEMAHNMQSAAAMIQVFSDCPPTPPAQIDTDGKSLGQVLYEATEERGFGLTGLPGPAWDERSEEVQQIAEFAAQAVAARVRAAPVAEAGDAQARVDQLERIMEEIRQWTEAYPLSVFPEPDLKRAHAALSAAGMTLDAISASCMRHAVKRVQSIVDKALGSSPAGGAVE